MEERGKWMRMESRREENGGERINLDFRYLLVVQTLYISIEMEEKPEEIMIILLE